MKVVTAPSQYELKHGEISVFLAGGITNCWEWQKAVIEELAKFDDTDQLVVYNPRRDNFPIGDPNAAQEQIEWEFKYLHQVDIFSMYFTAGDSDQPICMYELGVHTTRSLKTDTPFCVVVSVEDGYRRAQDVSIQMQLAFKCDIVNVHANARSHAFLIYKDYLMQREMQSFLN